MSDNSALVFLVVSDFGSDASVITDLLGIEPSSAWVRGQQISSLSSAIPPDASPVPLHKLSAAASPAGHLAALRSYVDAAPPPPAFHDRSEWRLKSPLRPWSAPLAEHLGALLALLEPHWEAVRRCSELYPTVIRCLVTMPELEAVLPLSPNLLAQAAQLRVSVDLELCFGRTDPPASPVT